MICSQCGKELPDGSAFCKYCGAKQAAPVQEPVPAPVPAPAPDPIPNVDPAPVIDPVPVAPIPGPVNPGKPPKAPKAPKAPGEKKKGLGGLGIALIIVAVIAVALAGLNVYQYLTNEDAKKENEENVATLEKKISKLDGEVKSVKADLDSANEELANDQDTMEMLRQDKLDLMTNIEDLTEQLDAADYEISDLRDQLDSASGDVSEYEATITELEQQIEDQNKTIDELKKEVDGLMAQLEARPEISEEDQYKIDMMDEFIVFINTDEKIYHKLTCEDLDLSSFWAMNIDLAEAEDFPPCEKCIHAGE